MAAKVIEPGRLYEVEGQHSAGPAVFAATSPATGNADSKANVVIGLDQTRTT
jgi:hypothetical protein